MNLNFKDKIVLVTGAAGGLGSAIAKAFAEHDAIVLVADLDAAKIQVEVDKLTTAGGRAFPVVLDVANRQQLAEAAAKVVAEHGHIDVLINNAGVTSTRKIDEDGFQDEWDRLLSINLHGVQNVTYAFKESLKETKGAIVNTASICSFINGISAIPYIVSKGGVRSLTQALARDFAKFGIRVNAIAPGLMLTPLVDYQIQQKGGIDWYMSRVPMARAGQPEEVAGPVLFLASNDLASYVNGATLAVDGGFLTS